MYRASLIDRQAFVKAIYFLWRVEVRHLFFAAKIAVNTVSIFNYRPSSLSSDFINLKFITLAVFYDVGPSKARAQQELKINVNLNKRSVSSRLWEVRISQIPFSARAPSGCLQYFTGTEGKW
jgi:hypothetical protein